MDLGFFKRSRSTFAGWILAPILVLIAVCAIWWTSSRATHEALRRRSAYLEVLPAIDQKLDAAHSLLHRVVFHAATGGAVVDSLTSDIQEAARRQSFTINSVSFKEVKPADDKPGPILAWTGVIKGEGSLTSIVRLLSNLHTDHRLLVVESTTLQAIGAPEKQTYAGEFKLRFLDVRLPEEIELAHHQEEIP